MIARRLDGTGADQARLKSMHKVTLQALALFLALFPDVTQGFGPTTTTISNVEPRRDTSGAILNAHDGAMYHVNGTYYLVGTSCKCPHHAAHRECCALPCS
eukprot:SAG11_NODE_1577_length_4652_cov_12.631013_3_plen_101_part_00